MSLINSNGTDVESLMRSVMSATNSRIQRNMRKAVTVWRRITNGKIIDTHCEADRQ